MYTERGNSCLFYAAALASSTAAPGTGFDFGGNLNLYFANKTQYCPFKGLLDEMRLYNRALSPAELQALYNAGR